MKKIVLLATIALFSTSAFATKIAQRVKEVKSSQVKEAVASLKIEGVKTNAHTAMVAQAKADPSFAGLLSEVVDNASDGFDGGVLEATEAQLKSSLLSLLAKRDGLPKAQQKKIDELIAHMADQDTNVLNAYANTMLAYKDGNVGSAPQNVKDMTLAQLVKAFEDCKI